MIVDTHAHVYSPDEDSYSPIPNAYRPPVPTGTVEDLRKEMEVSGVDRAVLIQTSTFYRWDNQFTCDTSAESRDWAVGVCNLDPDDPSSTDILGTLVRKYNIKGLRSIWEVYGRPDHPGIRRLWSEASKLGIVVNALVPLQLSDELSNLLDKYQDLRVVLDHSMSLKAGPLYNITLAKVLDLARHPNLYAKITFLPWGSAEQFPFADMHDACKRIIEAYGPERCLWGSNFPTALWAPKVTYAEDLWVFRQKLGLNRYEQESILGKTAESLWFDSY